jgi:hypothetical protein
MTSLTSEDVSVGSLRIKSLASPSAKAGLTLSKLNAIGIGAYECLDNIN